MRRAAACGAALGASLLGAALLGCAAPAPALVHEHAQSVSGAQVPVVAFLDFSCSYCRVAHARLKQAATERGVALSWRLVHVPLRSHPNAEPAARAAICAERAGHGERAAEHLLSTSPLMHAEPQLLEQAEHFGMSAAALAECMHNAETSARLMRDRQQFEQAKFDGVPMIYVQKQLFGGARPSSEYAAALAAAAR